MRSAPARGVGGPSGRRSPVARTLDKEVSDASSYVNGQALAVDGGLLTGPLWRDRQPKPELLMDALRASGAKG